MLTEDGRLIGVGLSRSDAVRKAERWFKDNPDATTLFVDTEFSNFDLDATALSRNQFYAIQKGLAKAVEAKVEGLEKGLASSIAKAAMGRKFAIKPTPKFSPYTQPRHEVFLGEENIFPVLKNYAYSMEKKMALDGVLEGIRRDLGKIKDKQARENVLRLAEDTKGRYYESDKLADGILSWASQKVWDKTGKDWEPAGSVVSRFSARAKQLQANLKLGYRPVAGVINFAGGQGHTYVKFGFEALKRGWEFKNTPEGARLIEELRPVLGEHFVEEAEGKSLQGPLESLAKKLGVRWKTGSPYGDTLKNLAEPLGIFSAAEVPNREVAAATAYLVAKDGGLSESAAKEFAIRSTWFTQFTYNTAALGQWMRGPVGRLMFQFKPYLVKELEFISSLKDPVEVMRYVALQTAMAGPRGWVLMMRSVPFLSLVLPAVFWDKIEEWGNREIPRLSRGLGGALGVDISGPAIFQFPDQVADWAGPLASDISKALGLWNEVLEGKDIQTGDVVKLMGQIAPALRAYGKIWDQLVDWDGWVKDERGRRLYHVDNWAGYLAKNLAAAEDLTASQIRTEERIEGARRDTISHNKQVTVDRVLDAVEQGKEISPSLQEDLLRYGIKPSSLRRASRFRQLDAKTRRILMTEISRRPELLELYPELPAPY